MRSSQHRRRFDQPVRHFDQQVDEPDDSAKLDVEPEFQLQPELQLEPVGNHAAVDAPLEQPEQRLRQEVTSNPRDRLARNPRGRRLRASDVRAIAFLIAAFAILAACNRPVTAERAAKASAMSPQVKQEAERVRAVDSREDRPPGEPRVADRTMAEKVRQALIEERGLTAHELDVRARDGVVTLSGKIEERSDQDRMMLVARSIEGVRAVVSRLVLERPA